MVAQCSSNGPGKCSWAMLSNASVASNCCPLLSILHRASAYFWAKFPLIFAGASIIAWYCYEHYFHFSISVSISWLYGPLHCFKVTGSSPVEVLNCFQASLRNYKNCDHNCEDHSSFDCFKYWQAMKFYCSTQSCTQPFSQSSQHWQACNVIWD